MASRIVLHRSVHFPSDTVSFAHVVLVPGVGLDELSLSTKGANFFGELAAFLLSTAGNNNAGTLVGESKSGGAGRDNPGEAAPADAAYFSTRAGTLDVLFSPAGLEEAAG